MISTKEAASNSNRVHQFTSPDGQGMITMKPRIVYRRSGENLEFLNDCLATQIEAIIKELEKGCQSDPKFWSLINHQKKPQNETIIEKLETRECSDPRPLIPLRNKKELQKGGRSTPKFLDSIKNRKGSKNETIYGELEKRCRSHPRFWILKNDQKELQNQTSWELGKSGHNNPRLLDLIRNKKRSKNEISKKELKEGGRDHQRFWILKRDQVEPQNKTSWELEEGGCDYHEFWILKRDQVEFQNKTSWELEGGGYDYNEFWIPKRPQKKPQNTNSLGLQKGGLNNHRFLDFIKNTKRSRNETVDRELEGKAWRDLGANVLYSIYCTVQYTDGAIKRNRIGFSAVVIEVGTGNHDSKARFADTDIEGSLMIYVLKIHGNNCMGTHHFTPDQKCSVSERQIITQEDEADFPTVVIKANIDDSEIEVKLVDIDIKENMIVDELRTEVYEIDCMGPHLTPTCTGYYSNISNGSQEVAIAEGHSFHVGPNVDREVDTDGDRTVSVLQWLERKDTERSQYQANQITSSSVYFVVQEIEEGSAPKSGQN